MELSGEEKKLQALFSQLKGADEQATPHFGATWNRAQIAPHRIRVFNPAFVAAALLLVFGVVAFAVWSRYSRATPAPPPVIATAPQNPAPGTEASLIPTKETPAPKPKNAVIASRRSNATSHRNAMLAAADRKLQKDAKSISSWQSPTSALLDSPSDEIFSSLPELNQSATQLKSFLPSRSN
jgi:type VI protein secretion system component VasF